MINYIYFMRIILIFQLFYCYRSDLTRSLLVAKEVIDLSDIPDSSNYSCDALTRWLGSEKHYSNDKKDIIFQFILNNRHQCDQQQYPVLLLQDIAYGWSQGTNKRLFFEIEPKNTTKCQQIDEYAVIYLSNYSINNNFSHFLHGLLRLFCSLIDSRWIIWNKSLGKYESIVDYTLWLDEYFKITPVKLKWINALGIRTRQLKEIGKGQCVQGKNVLYGSGCVRLLPPEKWFGYPGCRASSILPAFGTYMRQQFMASTASDLLLIDDHTRPINSDPGLRVAFAVRDVGEETGRRIISNLAHIQGLLKKTQRIRSSTENVTFEHLDVGSTVRYMASVHIFISVHGAGMTNMFFMNKGSAVVEIIPYPLCNCRSPDYFYGMGGYYHGSSVAQGIRHYTYCVPAEHTIWHKQPKDISPGVFCSWKHLHSVDSVYIEPTRFISLMRLVERDLIAAGTIQLTIPVIHMSAHANG